MWPRKLLPLLMVLFVGSKGILGPNQLTCTIQTCAENFFREALSDPMSDILKENDVTFILYNRDNKNGTKLHENNIGLLSEGLPLALITHGWLMSADTDSVQDIVRGYLENLHMNIITVDWSTLSMNNYIAASYSTRKVGTAVGDLVAHLSQENFCTLNNTHLVGHSLGAHVMGVSGNRVQQVTGQRVGRITGLDPAGPLFEYFQPSLQYTLDSSDAVFVDVIHTNPMLGYFESLGDADFFPNGDFPAQPGCIRPICSHFRSYMYFAESIGNKNAFLSTQCSSFLNYLKGFCEDNPKVHMGQWTPRSARGNYYLTTKDTSPFSKM